jgi:hypothetical protein
MSVNPLSAVTKNFTSASKLMYVLSTCRWQEMGCALHLDVFDQPGKRYFYNNLLVLREGSEKAFSPEIYPSRC